MKYKTDKYPSTLDAEVLRYTTRRIRELQGETPLYNEEYDTACHPYIRRRLDEIKKECEEKNS